MPPLKYGLTRAQIVEIYNLGYCHGHNATVEGRAIHIVSQDMDILHDQEVDEHLDRLGIKGRK